MLERSPAVLKDRASARVNVMPALRARIGAALGKAMEGHILPALLANMAKPIPHFHDVIQAGRIIGEAGEEIANGKFLGHGLILHDQKLADHRPCVRA